jgi:hypothetical protein
MPGNDGLSALKTILTHSGAHSLMTDGSAGMVKEPHVGREMDSSETL